MRLVRVQNQVLLFDGTGRLVAKLTETVAAPVAQLAQTSPEFVGLYPTTLPQESSCSPSE